MSGLGRLWLVLPGVVPALLAAQSARVSVSAVGGDYREQSAALAFTGRGITGALDIHAGRFGLALTATRLDFDAGAEAAPEVQAFQMEELDVRGRIRLVSVVSVEAGAFRRWIDPEPAAQAVGAGRVGLRADYRIAPGADGRLGVAAVGGARFSGGGDTKLGVALGFGLSYGAVRRGARVTIDYEFLRLDRETTGPLGVASVPIQSSTARVGLALVF